MEFAFKNILEPQIFALFFCLLAMMETALFYHTPSHDILQPTGPKQPGQVASG